MSELHSCYLGIIFVLDIRFIFIILMLYYFQATEFIFSTTLIAIAIGMVIVQNMENCMLAPPMFSINVIIGIEPLVCVCVVPAPRLQPRATQPLGLRPDPNQGLYSLSIEGQ